MLSEEDRKAFRDFYRAIWSVVDPLAYAVLDWLNAAMQRITRRG